MARIICQCVEWRRWDGRLPMHRTRGNFEKDTKPIRVNTDHIVYDVEFDSFPNCRVIKLVTGEVLVAQSPELCCLLKEQTQ